MTNYPHRAPGEAFNTLARALVHPVTGEIVLQIDDSGNIVNGSSQLGSVVPTFATWIAMTAAGSTIAPGTEVEIKGTNMQARYRRLTGSTGAISDWRLVGSAIHWQNEDITRVDNATPEFEGLVYAQPIAANTRMLVEWHFVALSASGANGTAYLLNASVATGVIDYARAVAGFDLQWTTQLNGIIDGGGDNATSVLHGSGILTTNANDVIQMYFSQVSSNASPNTIFCDESWMRFTELD